MKKLALTALATGLLVSASAFAQSTTSPSTTPSTSPTAPSVKTLPDATTAPSMSPDVTSPTGRSTTTAPSMTAPGGKMTMTEEQARTWVDKVIYTTDGKNVGEVGAFLRDASGNITELHADIGGLMGIGETRVRLMPSQFQLGTDRVTISITEAQLKALPPVSK